MRSQLVERLGVVEPQIVHRPPDVASLAAAEEAIELADAYGVADGFPLDESQRFTLRNSLGERADGSWAAATVCDFEPRQNGKNDTCAARELAGLILFGERLIIHTAHEFPTANEAFLRLVAVFENWDDLRKRVARIRYANGEQGIELLSGQRLKYRARTGGSGRGFAKSDLIVYDEAQHLQAEHIAASGPSRLANPNNQSWYMGSGGLMTSVNAWRMRRRAVAGDGGRFAYVEHTAEVLRLVDGWVESEKPDIFDRDAWARANSAYGHRITDESMLSLYSELGPELFARECLCIWDPDPESEGAAWAVIARSDWEACKVRRGDVRPETPTAITFDISPDRSSGAIAAASPIGELTYVDVLDHRDGTGWMVDRLVELKRQHPRAVVACDATGPAGSLLDPLEKAGVKKVKALSTQEHKQACGGFFDAAKDHLLRHQDRPELNAALAGAEKRAVGDAWLWSRKDSSVDISPLVTVTLAHMQGRQKRVLDIDNYR